MLLQQRPRQQLEVKHLLYLVSLNECQAHFKKVLIFCIGCDDGDDAGSGGGGDGDDVGSSGGGDGDMMTNLFHAGEPPGRRIRSCYAFSFRKLVHCKMI